MSPRPPPAAARSGPIQDALDRAVQALQAGRFDEAERLVGPILKSNWGNAAAAQILGQALLLQGRAADAVEPLTRAARRTKDPAVETLLSRALADAGHGEAAWQPLRDAITRRPIHPPAFLELGNRLGEAGRFDEAAQVFEAGLAAAPQAVVLHVGLGYLGLSRNDRAGARRAFQGAHDAAPARRDAAVGLGNILSTEGEFAEAARLYRIALTARPDDAVTRIALAKCLLELGERAEGEALLRAAARGGPELSRMAATALAATPRGRLFLRPSAAARFLGV